MNGKYRIPDIHPYSAKVLDLLDRMLTVVPEGRASIEEVIECIVAIQEGISLPARRIMTMQLTGTTRNTGGSLEFVAGGIPRSIEVDSSNAPEDEEGKDPDEASESYTYYYTKALSDSAALTLCRSNNGSDTTGSSAVGGSLPEFATGDDSASDDTQWLEFQPGKPNHTARGQTARNKQRKSGTKKKRRHDTSMDPLSLGNTESTRKKSNETDKIQSDWALGVLNRLSSKSLTPIEPERSVDDRTDDGGFTVLKPSSHRKFTLNKVSKKRSGKSMSSAASMFLDTSSSASLLEKSMGMSDFGKKCATSSANLDGYSGDDSAWGFDSSAQHESSNFFSDSDVDDLDLLPSDFVNNMSSLDQCQLPVADAASPFVGPENCFFEPRVSRECPAFIDEPFPDAAICNFEVAVVSQTCIIQGLGVIADQSLNRCLRRQTMKVIDVLQV